MKKLLSSMVVMLVSLAASAQITWNVKLGGGIAMCTGDVENTKNIFVGKVGVGFEMPLSHSLSLMPSLEFAIKGTKTSFDGYDYEWDEYYNFEETFTPMYIQLPVVCAYRLNLNTDWNIVLKAGPYFAYGIKGDYKLKEKNSGESSDNYDLFSDGDAKRLDIGIDAGIDFEYHRFVIGLEYEKGFTSFASSDSDVDIFNQAAYLTVGYKF